MLLDLAKEEKRTPESQLFWFCFGLQDKRNEQLGNGQSDWLGGASAVGSRVLTRCSRNHRLKYWAKASNMNHLATTIMGKA